MAFDRTVPPGAFTSNSRLTSWPSAFTVANAKSRVYRAAPGSTSEYGFPSFARSLSAATTCSATASGFGTDSIGVPASALAPKVAVGASANADGWLNRKPVAPYITAHGRRNSPKYRCARRTGVHVRWLAAATGDTGSLPLGARGA